jgi:hypothetical protein
VARSPFLSDLEKLATIVPELEKQVRVLSRGLRREAKERRKEKKTKPATVPAQAAASTPAVPTSEKPAPTSRGVKIRLS